MNLYKFHSDPNSLKHRKMATEHVPQLKWRHLIGSFPDEDDAHDIFDPKPETIAVLKQYEHLWAKDLKCAYHYAAIIEKPFPAGEKVIAKDSHYAYMYAYHVLERKPFPAGEKAISTDATYASLYAHMILGKPFPSGEKAIATDSRLAFDYAKFILSKRFPAGEKAIAEDSYIRGNYEKAFNVKL